MTDRISPNPPEMLARLFHDEYEALAPHYSYETRNDTKVFDPHSTNGHLMIAVAARVLAEWNTRASPWRGMDSAPRDGSWVLIATKPHSRGTVVARWTQAHGKYTWCDEEGETYENAAHWTPLPEPPKEGE